MITAEPLVPLKFDDEEYFTPDEVSKKFKFSTDFIINAFVNEPDVIVVGNPESVQRLDEATGKMKLIRRYRSIRIPGSAIARVFGKMRGRKGRSRA